MSTCNGTSPEDSGYVLGLMYLFSSLPVLISNAIVMFVVIRSDQLHQPTLWNIAFMALCNFCYGLYFFFFAMPSAFNQEFVFQTWLIGPSACMAIFLYGQNIMNVVVAITDRYIAVFWPLKYIHIVSPRRFILAVTVTFSITITRLLFIIAPGFEFCYHAGLSVTGPVVYTPVGGLLSVAIPTIGLIIIFVLVGKILLEIARTRRRVSSAEPGAPRIIQFSLTIALTAGLFVLFYLPMSLCILYTALAGENDIPSGFPKFGIICLLLNSFLNVFIYAVTYKPFREASLKLFCPKSFRKQKQVEVNIHFMQIRTCAFGTK